MTDQDSSYRPRSPDFSGLPDSSFQPAADTFTASPQYPLTSPLAHRASYDASPFFTPQYQRPPQFAPLQHQQQYSPPQFDPTFDMARTRRATQAAADAEWLPHPPPHLQSYMPPGGAIPPPVKQEEVAAPAPAPGPAPGAGIEVKTKFPVARIKRIMQADEDVGKVAQVTPIAVSKALELFMISLVTKAAQEARDRHSKRVTAAHLKQAVVRDDVLDFLADIIAKVPDQSSRKHDDDGSDQNEGRKKKGGGRRKKEVDSD